MHARFDMHRCLHFSSVSTSLFFAVKAPRSGSSSQNLLGKGLNLNVYWLRPTIPHKPSLKKGNKCCHKTMDYAYSVKISWTWSNVVNLTCLHHSKHPQGRCPRRHIGYRCQNHCRSQEDKGRRHHKFCRHHYRFQDPGDNYRGPSIYHRDPDQHTLSLLS